MRPAEPPPKKAKEAHPVFDSTHARLETQQVKRYPDRSVPRFHVVMYLVDPVGRKLHQALHDGSARSPTAPSGEGQDPRPGTSTTDRNAQFRHANPWSASTSVLQPPPRQ
ncbi:hypothetical protein GCM10009678_57630 [Actinomadura kijaniata]